MADQKITELTALTAPALSDLLAIVDDPGGGSEETKKIQLEDLFAGLVPDAAGLKPASDSATAIQLQTSGGTVVLNVDTSNKRIGINATDPGSLLEVRGDAGAAGILTLSTAETTVVDGDVLGQIDFQAPKEASGTDAIVVAASIYAEADDTFAADNNEAEIVFATAESGAATEKARITKDGKIGLGITTPGTDLHVHGDSTSRGRITISNSDTEIGSNAVLGALEFRTYDAGSGKPTDGVVAAIRARSPLTLPHYANHFETDLVFLVTTGNTFSEAMRIEYSGNVGINATSPSAQLHIDQSSTTGAQPVLLLDQADVSEEFVRFVGTAAAGTLTQSIVDEGDQASETREGWLKVYVQDDGNQITDQAYFIPIYSLSA